jgi:hypothetical protein
MQFTIKRSITHCIRTILITAAFLGLFGLAARNAQAQAEHNTITPSFTGVAAFGGGEFTWSYDVFITESPGPFGRRLEAGDFFTIYDFAGFVVGSEMNPAGWTFASSPLGLDPVGVTPSIPDSPAIPNLTWTYTGATIDVPGPPFFVDLGDFSARSIYTVETVVSYTSQDTQTGGALDGLKAGDKGDTIGPRASAVPISGAHTAIIGMLGSGLFWLRSRKFRS